jgi:hypothetical protein
MRLSGSLAGHEPACGRRDESGTSWYTSGCMKLRPDDIIQGVNTSRSIQDSTLVVDDFLPDLDRTDDGSFALRSVYKRLQGHFVGENSVSPSLVIVDDLASLSWMDFSALELSRFARALCALTRQVRRSCSSNERANADALSAPSFTGHSTPLCHARRSGRASAASPTALYISPRGSPSR